MKTAQSLSVLVLSVCLSALCAHAEDRPEPRAQMAAEAWLGHVDVGDYATSWQEASAYFQGAVTEHEWTASLNGVRKPLGHVVSRKLQSVQHTTRPQFQAHRTVTTSSCSLPRALRTSRRRLRQ
jgi:Protein of unknown function (DUF4019)